MWVCFFIYKNFFVRANQFLYYVFWKQFRFFFYLATILISEIRKLFFLRVWIVLNDIHRFIRKNLPTKLAADSIYLLVGKVKSVSDKRYGITIIQLSSPTKVKPSMWGGGGQAYREDEKNCYLNKTTRKLPGIHSAAWLMR